MNKQTSLLSNSIFSAICNLCVIAFPVITFAYAARILGLEAIGRVAFSKSFITYFTVLAVLGMNQYGVREVAKRKADRDMLSKFVQEMLMINACTTAISYGLLFLSILLVPRLRGYSDLLLICSASIVLQGMGMEWLYQGMEEYRYIALRSCVCELGALAALFLFVRTKEDVEIYTVINVAARSGAYAFNFFSAHKYFSLKRYKNYNLKQHLRPLLYLFAVAISVDLYSVLDSTMLGFLQGDASVGRYTAAVKVNRVVVLLISSISAVVIPRLSVYVDGKEKEKFRSLVDKAENYVSLLAVPAAVGLFMLSDEIILLFSGSGFGPAALTMRILVPIVLVVPLSAFINNQVFVAMGKEKMILCATAIGAVTNFVCNMILIPRYAENGAAVATVLAETTVMCVCFFNARKFFDIKATFKYYYQYWLAALPIPLLVGLINRLPIHYIAQMALAVVLSAGCYFALLLCQGNVFMKQLLELLMKRLKKRIYIRGG